MRRIKAYDIYGLQVSSELSVAVSELVLDDVSDDDAALYTCAVASTLGMTQHSAWLDVLPTAIREYARQTWAWSTGLPVYRTTSSQRISHLTVSNVNLKHF